MERKFIYPNTEETLDRVIESLNSIGIKINIKVSNIYTSIKINTDNFENSNNINTENLLENINLYPIGTILYNVEESAYDKIDHYIFDKDGIKVVVVLDYNINNQKRLSVPISIEEFKEKWVVIKTNGENLNE